MRHACYALAFLLLGGCAEKDVLRQPDPIPGIEISSVEAAPQCKPLQAVEVRSGHHDPTTHELLLEVAADRGANYVVLDAFTVLANRDDIFAITFARLFQCPLPLFCYRCLKR